MRILFLTFLCASLWVFADPTPSIIREVTIFADRALVTREAQVMLPAGISEIQLEALPAWVNPASIRARIEGGEILDVNPRREFLTQTPDEEIRKKEDALQLLLDAQSRNNNQKKILEQSRNQILAISGFTSSTLPAEVRTRDIPVAYFREMVEFTQQGLTNISNSLYELVLEERKLTPEIVKLQSELSAEKQGNRLEQLVLTIQVKKDQAAPSTLRLSYELPGATWEVTHDVRVEKGNRVKIVSMGLIRQTTGEDWENVKLSFSTRRPGKAVHVPELETLLLGKKHAVNSAVFQGENDASGWSSANSYYLDNGISYNKLQKKAKRCSGMETGGRCSGLNRHLKRYL